MTAFVFELIFWMLLDLIGCGVAHVVLQLITGDKVVVQPLTANPLRTSQQEFLSYYRIRNGRIELDRSLAGLFGLIFCLLVAAASFLATFAVASLI
ncbi:hypothetical protein FXB40_02030 [Bradyrhizobium rifense]|uniref:Uncharacterized protein n=1 Tax=Bradyrhizobium rifense TaxID=515499 RepID=A0A5D3L0Y7_9BRAD|nr:hypothetical protein [Bradyrhizobium rifense]TYL99639.1 hypothetical protein FXB40_02030 [Bradyrhizobium rifense]